jgi:peptidyl-dipeptidase A
MTRLRSCRASFGAFLLFAAFVSVPSVLHAQKQSAGKPPTIEEARAFLQEVEQRMLELSIAAGRASWVQATYITGDSEALAAMLSERAISAAVEYAKQATRFDQLKLTPEMARKMRLLKLSLTLATPADPKESELLSRLVTGMESLYGRGQYCREALSAGVAPPPDTCLDIQQIENILASSRDPRELQDVWNGWHSISRPMKGDFQQYVELSNKGARQLGFKDTGAMWRSKYDMPPDDFARDLDRLWDQVKPLYVSLHAYVRKRLRETYGADVVPANGPIPAHLLGNLWAQSWENTYPMVAPPESGAGFDLSRILRQRKIDEREMVRIGERFFTSLGFQPLPETFWERSLFTKPRDRDVVCHASAWQIDYEDDLRIKMCIEIKAEDFATIHHELGHNFYQRAYKHQPLLFRDSANDGFHEAVGDVIGLSVTPEYLVKIGLLDRAPDASGDIGLLLGRALEKVAFLPFGLLIDQWRWKVFSGEITPQNYNRTWWDLKRTYQGVAPPQGRTEQDFDPGAKYHVAANVPYTRYFLAHILQFQMHQALARAAGCKDPLHRCSIYGSSEAGERLQKMLAMGQSRPWPEALEVVAGTRQMDGRALMEYFAPLKEWLDKQNAGQPTGW